MTKRHYRRTLKASSDIQAKIRVSAPKWDRVHVLADGNRWAVKREDARRADRLLDVKSDAVSRARSLSRVRNVIVHKRDGTIDSWERPSSSKSE